MFNFNFCPSPSSQVTMVMVPVMAVAVSPVGTAPVTQVHPVTTQTMASVVARVHRV